MARDILLTLTDDGVFDLVVQGRDVAGDDSFGTAVLISLFTDARAQTDELPPEWQDPRGWWADAMLAENGGDARGMGSRLWLLAREKQTQSVMARAEDYARQALQWLIDDGLVAAVDVSVANPKNGILALEVEVTHLSPQGVQHSTDRWTVTLDGATITMMRAA